MSLVVDHDRAAGEADFEESTYRLVTWRLMPLLFACYILAYIDRINVGFAKLQMQRDLGMSDSVYGIGAGIFFIGYFFFEVPANMLLQRLGAKRWLGSIMIVWGATSASTMLVHSAGFFYVLRFLLGVVESGFFPGAILYLTFWYPARRRARMVALFMTAIPLSGLVGGAVSGWILEHFSPAAGLQGWQWLYLLEGLPSVLAGIVAVIFLENGPAAAKWLTPGQRDLLLARLRADEDDKARAGHQNHRMVDAFLSPGVWLLSAVYFGFVMGSYGVGFWLPQIISETLTHDPLQIGLLSMIPWGVGALVMVLVGRHSDKTGERRWHVAISGLVGGAAFAVSAIPDLGGRGWPCGIDGGDGWSDGLHRDFLVAANDVPVVGCGRGGHRLDQFGGEPGGLHEPVPGGPSAGRDAQHAVPASAFICFRVF